MDEQNIYKDNFLIPVLRKKVGDLSAAVIDMEATIIYQNAKIKDLSEKLSKIVPNNVVQEDSSVSGQSKQRKKTVPASDGGTF
jgi:hypothetical protein